MEPKISKIKFVVTVPADEIHKQTYLVDIIYHHHIMISKVLPKLKNFYIQGSVQAGREEIYMEVWQFSLCVPLVTL